MNNHLWYKDAVFYELYVRAFKDSNGDGHGDLPGATQQLEYLKMLGVDCIWLLPIYPSPLKDDGYDISDFYGIHPDYGTIEDFRAFVMRAHELGMRVILDLVLNHTSDQIHWFQEARRDRHSPYRDYYVWSDTDEKYQEARIIFLDSEPSNWTWDEVAGQYYWHRFYASQPDLNYDNTAVHADVFKIARYWLEMGVDGFRVDAVPYLYEREGTNCENLPETHAFLKQFRRFMDEHYPGRILLCEANQWPEDVRAYFGDGDEFHMGFHFPVMPRIYMALRQGDCEPLRWILERTPPIPENCQWCTFLRNHDELTLEMVTEEERQWMWAEYAPEPRMRLNLGIRRRLAPLLDNDRRKIELANSLLLTLPGSPVIYYGDEIGMGDNIGLPDRNGVRTPMQWDASPNASFSTAQVLYAPVIAEAPYGPPDVNVAAQLDDPGSLLHRLWKMVALRKQHRAFGWGTLDWLDCANPHLASYRREFQDTCFIILNNLSASEQVAALPVAGLNLESLTDILTGEVLVIASEPRLEITLKPYEFRWCLCG
jgi:maltose alpha-D-glucosyltransferase / alpha-amylase